MTRHRIFLLLLLVPLLTAQSPLSNDADALFAFKTAADAHNKLNYTLRDSVNYCQWRGVKCARGRVVRLVLNSFKLGGTFPPNTLSNLNQLRVLSLPNNSLTGPIPQLAQLVNPHKLGLNKNEDLLNLERVGVTGIAPVRLFPETSKTSSNDWFSGGIEPLNRFQLSRSE